MPTEKNINNLKLNFGSSTSIDLTQLSDGELVFYTSDPTNANKIMALNNSGVVSYLSLDLVPTLNSSNLLTSGAIYTALGNKINKVSTPNIVYGTDENGDQTTYSKDSFGQVEDVQVNGTSVVSNKIANVTVPTKTSDLTNDSGFITSASIPTKLSDFTDDLGSNPTHTHSQYLTSSALNGYATESFVNSSIATNTAYFRGTSASGLTEAQFLSWANGLTKTNNDYVFWNTTDSAGNVCYKRYKYNGTTWEYEYTLNNSSFTSAQWGSINSGITDTKVGNYDTHIASTSNPHNVTKSQVGLGNVENKSSATIRSEITSSNVTTALGYTPLQNHQDISGKANLSGGNTFSGDQNFNSNASITTAGYIKGTWLQTTADIRSSATPSAYAVLSNGWIYSRTLAQTKTDLGVPAITITEVQVYKEVD